MVQEPIGWKMIIYSGYIPYKTFPYFRRQKGTIFNRLIGINIFNGAIEPVYQPIIQITNEGNSLWITLSNIDPLILIVLAKTAPFIYIQRIEYD